MSKPQLQGRTASHYDTHPFEFMTDEDHERIDELQPLPFRAFVEKYLNAGDSVGEIGCGPGRGTMYLEAKGMAVTAIDLSFGSLKMAAQRATESGFVQCTNLSLPFPDECFDAVVSDGVIHHTPDPRLAFGENSRILKRGGFMYLGVYNRRGYYHYLYTYFGKPVRWLEKRGWGRAMVNSTLLPVYYLVHLVKSRGKRTWRGAKNFFYDYIITPQATFHSKEEIEMWASRESLSLQEYTPKFGNTHIFVFRKGNSGSNSIE